jgi:hypothetical protein
MLDRLFAPFEGSRDPLALAIVRVAFFTGLLVHFAPSLLWLDIGYGHGAIRTDAWNHWLFTHLWRIPPGVVRAMAIVTLAGCVAAIAGFFTRYAALIAFAGCYAFASFNSIHLQTLALIPAWAILMLWILCGERNNKLLGGLVLFQVLLAVVFSGVEKVLAGWPASNEMAIVLGYPHGFLVRDWVAALPFLHGPVVSHLLTYGTLVIELGAPFALLHRRTRLAAFVAWQAFFLGIIAMLEVPPLFYFIFAAGPVLALSDEQLTGARRWVRARVRRG